MDSADGLLQHLSVQADSILAHRARMKELRRNRVTMCTDTSRRILGAMASHLRHLDLLLRLRRIRQPRLMRSDRSRIHYGRFALDHPTRMRRMQKGIAPVHRTRLTSARRLHSMLLGLHDRPACVIRRSYRLRVLRVHPPHVHVASILQRDVKKPAVAILLNHHGATDLPPGCTATLAQHRRSLLTMKM